MRKRGFALLLAACVTIGSVLAPMEEAVSAENVTAKEAEFQTGGLLPMEVYEVSESDLEDADIYESSDEMLASVVYDSEWDKYANYYFYNQMTKEERRVWDELNALCLEYLTTEKNVYYDDIYGQYHMDYVSSTLLSSEQIKEVYYIFRYNNPQYYFLQTACMIGYANNGTKNLIAPIVYPSFAAGAARKTATEQVKSQADSWQRQIDACSGEAQKVQLIHDLIVQKVEYNSAIYENDFDENIWYSQSAYSVFCMDVTVCAGYSQAFEMMCNSSGLDAIAVTSQTHEWNKVRVDDSWYNVDCTWADQGNTMPIYYDFFGRNDLYYDTASQASSHKEEKYWEKYLPQCTLDSTYTGWKAGTFPTITKQMLLPSIVTEKQSDNRYEVTLSAVTEDAKIYYTTDGSKPAVSAAKSYLYNGTFSVESGDTIKAVVVCNGYFDSETSSCKAGETYITPELPKEITVTFDGNGAVTGTMPNQTAYENIVFTLHKNTFERTGYTFAGWNTKPDGSGDAYADEQKAENVDKSMTLYAQWTPIVYTIAYELNGGTGAENPTSYNCTQTIIWNAPTRIGYTFTGWYEDAELTQKTEKLAEGSIGDRKLYAGWRANQYRIAFNGNGSDGGSMEPLTGLEYDKKYIISDCRFTKTNYIFVNWNTNADGSGMSYESGDEVKNLTDKADVEIVLYAQWKQQGNKPDDSQGNKPDTSQGEEADDSQGDEPDASQDKQQTYKIYYKLNGGKNHKDNPAVYTKNTPNITLKKPTRTGYTFKGWYSDKKCTQKVSGIKKGSVGNKTFYAKWQKKKYKITYKLNGGKNAAKNPSYYYVTSKTITLKAPKKSGYVFKGWYTDKKCRKKITKIKKGSTGNMTLYAKWKKK